MPGEFPIATPQFGDAINVPGQTTKRYRKVVSVPCTTRTCAVVFPPDVETYSLQDSIFFNATALSFLVTCPPGRVCPPGTYPKVITYPPGTFIMPDPNVTPGFPIYLAMTGCQSVVSRYLDADATAAEISAAAQEIIYEVAQQQAQCDAVADDPEPPAPNFRNQQVFALVDCPEDTQLQYSGTMPSYLTLDVINSRVVMTAGVVSGLTQAAANAVAQTIVDDWTDSKFTAGTLSCESSPGDCDLNQLTWGAPFLVGAATGSGSANNAQVSAACTGLGPNFSSEVILTGSMSYTGPETPLSLIWDIDTINGGNVTVSATITSSVDGVLLNSGYTQSTGSPGVTSFPFTLPASAGATITVEINVYTGDTDNPGTSGYFDGSFNFCGAGCTITNSSPLPSGEPSTPYSETLTVTGLTGTPTWSVSDGALPDGLTLNASTGEISGTPTTEETANFTISVTNGDGICEKEFELEVTSTPPYDCLGVTDDINSLVWTYTSLDSSLSAMTMSGAGASGSFSGGGSYNTGFSSASSQGILTAQLCNPTESPITVRISYSANWSMSADPADTAINTELQSYGVGFPDLLFEVASTFSTPNNGSDTPFKDYVIAAQSVGTFGFMATTGISIGLSGGNGTTSLSGTFTVSIIP